MGFEGFEGFANFRRTYATTGYTLSMCIQSQSVENMRIYVPYTYTDQHIHPQGVYYQGKYHSNDFNSLTKEHEYNFVYANRYDLVRHFNFS